jgi:hypothetical protein
MTEQKCPQQEPDDRNSDSSQTKPAPRRKPRRSATKARKTAAATVPSVKIVQDGDGIYLRLDCEDYKKGAELLMKAIGVEDENALYGILEQLAHASQSTVGNEKALNSMVSFLIGLKPRDQAEALFAAQMVVVHWNTMEHSRYFGRMISIDQVNVVGGMFIKLGRLFATQIETWRRYRSGEPNISVQNVSVTDGGQAIVTQNTVKGVEVQAAKPPLAIGDAHSMPMPILEQASDKVIAELGPSHDDELS